MTMDPKEMSVISSESGRLHVQMTAAIRVENSARLFEAIRQRAEADGATHLLIDASAHQGRLTVFQRLHLALSFVARRRRYRVAGVFSETTVDPQRLGETMANNRGANLRVFTDLAEAEAWLGHPAAEPANRNSANVI